MVTYKNVVSVGYNCGAAYQIRLHTRSSEAHFFDWLYTSVPALNYLLENDFKGFMEKANLAITREGSEVTDGPSGIRFNHSFKPGGNGRVSPDLLESDYEREKSKFDYMASKFRNLLRHEDPLCLIRYNPHIGHYDKQKDLENTVVMLKTIRRHPFVVFWVKRVDLKSEAARTHISDHLVEVLLPEDESRSKSAGGRSFLHTDDVAWGEFFATLPHSRPSKRLADGEGVFDNRKV